MSKEITVPEKQTMLRMKRNKTFKIRNEFLKTHSVDQLVPGAGKGLEPDPLCECHNRNPCPIDKELGL